MSEHRKKPKKKQTPPMSRRLPRPVMPLAPEKFTEAFQDAVENMANPEPTPNLLLPRLNIIDEGKMQEIKFTDSPPLRMIETLRLHYKDDQAAHHSAAIRAWALFDVIDTDALNKWIKIEGEQTRIHDAVIRAAATAQLYDAKGFALELFMAEVQKHVSSG